MDNCVHGKANLKIDHKDLNLIAIRLILLISNCLVLFSEK